MVIVFSILLRTQSIRYFLLPGNGAVTEVAIRNLMESLQDGSSFGEAVTAFCFEIINNAG